MLLNPEQIITQRADYTFKHNRNFGRHGWLRLTPAYSVKLVNRLIEKADSSIFILDPFSGTATTGLAAAEQGNQAITFDINPFLIWLGNVKCQNYSTAVLTRLNAKVLALLGTVENRLNNDNWIPSLFNIERWWSKHTLKILAALRATLVESIGELEKYEVGSLAWVAFCRLVIETSTATFNHVSMSFSTEVTHYEVANVIGLYQEIFDYIISSCANPVVGSAKVLHVDARFIPKMDIKFNLVVTSPPYPNRMSYIRELRPYMYWTKFIESAREAGEMDWQAIGGTWGIATSRLNNWIPEEQKLPALLYETVNNISKSESKNGKLLANYVLKYFHDMHLHLASLRQVLSNNAELHYIVGNSIFFGNMVDTAEIIAISMNSLGYKKVKYEMVRKRNCNKALFEYDVSARWTTSERRANAIKLR